MHTKDELLKMKWETAIRLEGLFERLKTAKARYFKLGLIDLAHLPENHPQAAQITEDMDAIYKQIRLTEEGIQEIVKDSEKLNALINKYKGYL